MDPFVATAIVGIVQLVATAGDPSGDSNIFRIFSIAPQSSYSYCSSSSATAKVVALNLFA